MAIEKLLTPGVHQKQWETVKAFGPLTSAAGMHVSKSRLHDQFAFIVQSAASFLEFDPFQGATIPLPAPSPAFAGTFGAGATSTTHPFGPSGTATAGTTTTMTTNLTLARDLRGYKVRLTGGPGAGSGTLGELTIASNTVGPNSVITFTSPASATITASTTYQLLTGRWYVLNCGTVATNIFRVYDYATNTWSAALVTTNLPATLTTTAEIRLVSTPSIPENGVAVKYNTVTAVASSTSTVVTQAGTNYAVNQWANFQVRIVGGTGAGQTRTITSNTATTITVPAFTVTPDATSVIHIEGNDDFLYLFGNAAVTAYRYSISGNAWTVLSPGVARAGAPSTGMSAAWVTNVDDTAWSNADSIINGRRIYSFRGGAAITLDYYDIPSNAWVNAITYAPGSVTVAGGTSYTYHGNFLYLAPTGGQLVYRYDFTRSEMQPWHFIVQQQGTAVIGDKLWDFSVTDGETIDYIYWWHNTSNACFRTIVID
jgi:hypothetical protein